MPSDDHGAALVPTGRQLKSYACMRSFARQGIDFVVASEHERLPHFSSRFCSERVTLPAPPGDVTAYKDSLLDLASRGDVATILPVRECDAFVLAKYREEFEEYVSLVTPRLDTLRKGHDRLRLAREAEAAGVPHAETRALSEVDVWNRDVVVKSRYNVLTGEYVDAFPSGELAEVKQVRSIPRGVEPDVETVRAEMRHDPIVQEFVPQAEKRLYCALWDHGEPLATYTHRQIRQNSWMGGGGVYRESVAPGAVEDVAADLLSHLDWHGFACIEYVKDERTGEWTFLELNPRLWQSLPEAVRAGADFPYYYWLRATGAPERIDHDYEVGARCHIAYGEVAHLLSVLRDDSPFLDRPSFAKRLWEIASSFVANPRFDYIRRDDPGLFLGGLRDTLGTGVTPSRQFRDGSPGEVNPPRRPPVHADGGTREQ